MKKFLSIILAILMVVSMLPASALSVFAAEGTEMSVTGTATIDLSQYSEGAIIDISEDNVIIGDGNEYNISLNITENATVTFDIGTSGVKLGAPITVADGKTLTLLVAGDAEHTVNGGISLGNGSNVIIEGDLTKENNKLTVTATGGNAGIGANNGVTAGDITIRNARVDATGSGSSDGSGAAIGTSDASMGNILIDNSIVIAAGGYYNSDDFMEISHAAAIGMGYYGGTIGNITLKNSEITASNNGDGLASVIGAGSQNKEGDNNAGTLGDIIITNTDLNLSMVISNKNTYAAIIGPGMGYSYAWTNMGKIIFTDVTQTELDEMIANWLPSDFNEWGAYALGRGYDGSAYKKETFGGVWVSDGNGGTVQIGDESGYYINCNKSGFVHDFDEICGGTCSDCGVTYLVVHTGGNATYTDNGDGTHSFTCTTCGTTVTEEHSGGTATCTAKAVCALCGESYGELGGHTGGTATCTTLAVCDTCGESYGELDPNNHEYENNNGFCCETYQPAELNENGYYAISNAGQLYWFAQQVNSGSTAINGELTADIVVNENVLTADGSLNGDGSNFRAWTPIGTEDNAYTGEFRGGGHTVSGLYFNDRTVYHVGLFGYVGSGGTVQNVGVIDSYFYGYSYVGGVAGCNCGTLQYVYNTGNVNGSRYAGGMTGENKYIVQYAYNTGTVFAMDYAGGVTGYNKYIVQYAYNTGSAGGAAYYGGIAGDNRHTLKDCYYLADSETDSFDGTTAKTAGQFEIGEVAYLLGSPFGQNIGTHVSPVLNLGYEVYQVQNCKNEVVYSNTNENLGHQYENGVCTICGAACPGHSYENGTCTVCGAACPGHSYENGFCTVCGAACPGHSYENGFCTVCGAACPGHSYENGFCPYGCYEPAVLNNDGVYEIYNAGQLYWFAAQVDAGKKAISGKLMADIVVNEGTVTASSTGLRAWNPIGYYNSESDYITIKGTFDGNNKTVSGLYFNSRTAMGVGLFSCVDSGSIVKNVGVINSYIKGRIYVGGVAGYVLSNGTVENCYNAGTVNGNYSDNGGVIGRNYGTVENCYNTGTVGGSTEVGGVIGKNFGTVKNCYNTGTVNGSGSYIGGVVGYNYKKSIILNCYNTGTVSGGRRVGGVIGENEGTVENSYNTGIVSGYTIVGGVAGWNLEDTVQNCYNTGNISGSGDYVGGVAGWNYDGTVQNCYNTGTVSGVSSIGGVLGGTNSGRNINCYNIGTVSGESYVGGVMGYRYSNAGTATNCYYLIGCAKDGNNTIQYGIGNETIGSTTADSEGSTIGKSTEQFASGEVAYLLNGSTSEGELVWGQLIGTDSYPVFGGETVYYNETDGYYNILHTCDFSGEWKYDADKHWKECTADSCSETSEEAEHSYTDGKCDCGYECTHENETGDTCSVCGATIKFATITGVSINIDGVIYTSDNTSAENPAVILPDSVVTFTVIGENFDLLSADPENAMIGFTYFGNNIQGLYNNPSKFDIDTVNNTVSFLANYDVLPQATTASELTYTNDGWNTDIGSGVYVIYIDKKDIADTLITLDNTEFIYSGNPIEPTVLVMADGQTLMADEHYTLTFESNVNAGTASVTVKGIGDYTGEVTKEFTITKAYYNLTAPTPDTLTYNGENQYLVSAGTVEGADFEYSLDGARWSTSIPQAKDAGNYTVYYRVLADENHYGIEGAVDVTIKECAHEWGEGVLTRPVYDAVLGSKDGYYTYTCTLCGEEKTETVKSADYSAYEAVSEEINALLQSDELTNAAKQAIYSAANKCGLPSNDLTESEQNIVDDLVAELEKIVADAEEKIASGEYVKADYTEIDEAIASVDESLENATISEEMANELSDIKSQLEALKENENTSMADAAELLERVKAVAETMADCAKGVHSFTKYEEVTAPECGKAGLEKAVCDYGCGATDEKEIPALTHEPLAAVKENEVAPKCGVAGSYDLVVYCELCGEELDRDTVTVDALTHKDDDGDYKCDHGCGHEFEKPAEPDTPDEPADGDCDHLCHKSGIMSIFWKIIRFFYRLFNIQQYCDCGEIHYDAPVFG